MNSSVRIVASTTALMVVVLLLSVPATAQSDSLSSKGSGNDAPSSLSRVEQRLEHIEQKLLELERRLNAATGQASEHPSSPSSSTGSTLDERFDALNQQVRNIERKRELEQEEGAVKQSQAPVVVAGKEGFALRSADGNFQLKLRGYFQADSQWFLNDETQAAANTFILRRARPIVEGTVFKIFDFRIMTDFGAGQATIQDLHLDARIWPQASFRFGKFKSPFGLERLQSATDLMFILRATPTALAPNRDLGLQMYGDFGEGLLSYQVGVFNGVIDGGSGDLDDRDGKEVIARVFAHPFKKSQTALIQGLGVGFAADAGRQNGNATTPNLPSYRTNGQIFFRYRSDGTPSGTTIADGQRYRFSPQAYYYAGPFGLMTEYVLGSQEIRLAATTGQIKNDAWQVAASYVLTGEKQSYLGLTPKEPFDLKANTYGAFEIAGRYHQLKVGGDAFPIFANPQTSSRKAGAWTVGLNWYLNRNVKFVLDYEQTKFDGGAIGGDRKTEKAVLNRFQISF